MIASRVLAGLLCLSLGAGASNALPAEVPQPDGFREDDYNAPVPGGVPGGETLDTASLQALIAAEHPVLVDVLPAPRRPPGMRPDAPWLPVPRRDIPGSVWLPEIGRGALSPGLQAWMQRELDGATGGHRDRPIVFYCRAECWMSWNAAKRAVQTGWQRVFWYPEGTEGWSAAGLDLTEAKPEPYE